MANGLISLVHIFPLSVMSQLININGGHSKGYIRNCIWQTLHPKLLIDHTLHNYNFTFWLFRDNHFNVDSFYHSLTGWYGLHYFVSISGFGYLEVDLGVIVGSY